MAILQDYLEPKKINKPVQRPTTIEELRKERLEREQKERARVQSLLEPSRHESQEHYYHSQFNPDAVRKRH